MKIIVRLVGLILIVGGTFFLYKNIEKRSDLPCMIDPSTVTISNTAKTFKEYKEVGEELVAKYLESYNAGRVCADAIITGYKINNITTRKETLESFIMHAAFDVSPLGVKNSTWLSEFTPVEDNFILGIERDFLIQRSGENYSILDVIEK